MSAACRECGQPIRWARTQRGGWMPLDPRPDERGQLVIRGDVALSVARANERRRPGEPLWQAHHFTCPARKHGARDRETAVNHEHARLDREAAEAVERDTDPPDHLLLADHLRHEARLLRDRAAELDRLAGIVAEGPP